MTDKVTKPYFEERDERAYETWMRLQKELNPQDNWEKKDFQAFILMGNRSQTFEAARSGFDRCLSSGAVKEMAEALSGVTKNVNDDDWFEKCKQALTRYHAILKELEK